MDASLQVCARCVWLCVRERKRGRRSCVLRICLTSSFPVAANYNRATTQVPLKKKKSPVKEMQLTCSTMNLTKANNTDRVLRNLGRLFH
jgi:hypothetical protein